MQPENPAIDAAIQLQIQLLRAQLPADLVERFLPAVERIRETKNYGRPLLTDLDLLEALYLIQLYQRGFADEIDVRRVITGMRTERK